MKFAVDRLKGARGLGFDIDPRKVDVARSSGFDAIVADILQLPTKKLVEFTLLSHFLEHVDYTDVHAFIERAVAISSEYVLIQQPFFDNSLELLMNGVKLSYSDWIGHRNRFSALDFFLVMRDLKNSGQISDFSIGGFRQVKDSSNAFVVPLWSPIDTIEYSPEHGPKASVEFSSPIFQEICIVASVSSRHEEHLKLARVDQIFCSTL